VGQLRAASPASLIHTVVTSRKQCSSRTLSTLGNDTTRFNQDVGRNVVRCQRFGIALTEG